MGLGLAVWFALGGLLAQHVTPLPMRFGVSAEGRPLVGLSLGRGGKVVVVVGGIHGQPELNSSQHELSRSSAGDDQSY